MKSHKVPLKNNSYELLMEVLKKNLSNKKKRTLDGVIYRQNQYITV